MEGFVVSIGGQKGGSGKSTVAQGLAVEAEKNGATAILADMDIAQQTSLRWAQRRNSAGLEPKIDARLLRSLTGIRALQRLCDILIIDMPGRADVTTRTAAEISDLMVLTTDTNVFELEPTVMLMHELKAAGLGKERVVIALTKVLDARREGEARGYLETAGYEALPVPLMFNNAAHDVGNEGRAVTELRQERFAGQARQFFLSIVQTVTRSRPERSEERSDKQRNRGERER
jgi:chromosome partitioning protein